MTYGVEGKDFILVVYDPDMVIGDITFDGEASSLENRYFYTSKSSLCENEIKKMESVITAPTYHSKGMLCEHQAHTTFSLCQMDG